MVIPLHSGSAPILDGRPAPEDLAQLDASCFNPAWDAGAYTEHLQDPAWRCWILRLASPPRLLAFAACRKTDGDVEIVRLGVSPGVRERGWGKRLLSGVLTRLAKERVRRVFLEVREGNRPALAIYEDAGFREVERHPNFYAYPPEDAIIMARDLGRRRAITVL